jgi:hypothetical protein
MRILNRLFARVWNFGFGRRGDDRLREELEGHIAMQAEENVRAGMTPTEARRQAVLKLGAVEAIREQYREEEGLPQLEHLLHDFRYALRQLRKSPGFTLAAVLTLTLGIGATTAIFTLAQQVMLQSLPVNRPDQLWRIGDQPHCLAGEVRLRSFGRRIHTPDQPPGVHDQRGSLKVRRPFQKV